jgi:hypothetical protein
MRHVTPAGFHYNHSRSRRLAHFSESAAAVATNMIIAGESLAGHPHQKLITGAIGHYARGCKPGAGKCCIGCRLHFIGGELRSKAFLVSTSAVAPDTAATSAFCPRCWDSKSDAEIERACVFILRRILPRGRFLDPTPSQPEWQP